MDEKLYNSLTAGSSVDVANEEWYRTADAIFNARMTDYANPGQPGGYQSYVMETRKYNSNLDPLQTMGYLHAQQAIDSNWEYAQNLGKSFYNGGIGVVRDTLNGIRAARDYNIALLNEQAKAQGFERNPDQSFVEALDNAAKADALQPFEVKRSASKAGQFGLDLAQGAGQLAGQIAASIPAEAVLPGVGGMAVMVGQITGGQYEDLKAKGVDTKRAAEAAFANAMIQAPFERLSLTRLMRRLPAGSVLKKKVKSVLEDAFTEGITETIQQFPEEWAELWALNPDKSWKELQSMAAKKFPDTLQNALYAGLIGAVLGAGSRGIHIALDRNIDLVLRKELHDETLSAMDSRVNHVKQSGISPDYAGETINANLNNATVLIDGATLSAYAQRVGEEKAAEKLGVTVDDIREAASKGDTVEVKQGNFEALAASDPSFYQEVRDDLSFDTNDMSNRKYDAIQANIERYSKVGERQRKELKTEIDKIADSMEKAGVPKGQIAGMKTMLTSFAISMRPDNPAQFIRDNALRFERATQMTVQPTLNYSSRTDDLNLVKDILTANYENPRQEVENRLKEVEEQIRQISDGERTVENEQELPRLTRQRDVLRTLLNDVTSGEGVAGVPSIEDYKNIYDRENGTFNVPEPGQYKQVSSRVPYSKTDENLVVKGGPDRGAVAEDAVNNVLTTDFASAKAATTMFKKNVDALRKLAGLGVTTEDTDQAAEEMIQRMVDNLLFLFNMVEPEQRDRAKLWYDGGRKLAEEWAKRYNISPMAAAGVIAVLSPQQDWFTNVTLAERILDAIFSDIIYKKWTPEMTDAAIGELKGWKKNKKGKDVPDWKIVPTVNPYNDTAPTNVPALERITGMTHAQMQEEVKANKEAVERAEGKTLKQLLDEGDFRAAAIWIRTYDQVSKNRSYRVITPEGGTGGFVKLKDGKTNATASWGDYGSIEKAISIAFDPSYTNVFVQVGDQHKVRNFFNNIYAPWDPRFITMDTHAVAAALLRPLSGSSVPVEQNFGNSHGASTSALFGLKGTYPIYFEAYRRAAEIASQMTGQRYLPREMQSITWEAVRLLFPATEKDSKKETPLQKYIREVWEDVDSVINDKDVKEDNKLIDVYNDWKNGKIKTEDLTTTVLEEARKKIRNEATKGKNKLPEFAWQKTPADSTIGDTYNRENVKLRKVTKEVNGKETGTMLGVDSKVELAALFPEFAERLKALSSEKQALISSAILNSTVYRVLAEFDTYGGLVPALETNGEAETPGYNVKVLVPTRAVEMAKMLGRFLNQDSVVVVSPTEINGTEPDRVMSITLPEGWGPKELREFNDTLRKKVTDNKGNPLVSVYSTEDGRMVVVNTSKVATETVLEKVKSVAPNFEIKTEGLHAAVLTKEDYAKEEVRYDSESETENKRREALKRRDNYIKRQIAQEFERELLRAERPEVSGDVSGMGSRNGSETEGTPEQGTGRVLGQAEGGTGLYGSGRVALDGDRVVFEVAPDPNNKALTEAWNKLKKAHPELAQQYSEEIAAQIVPKLLAKYKAETVNGIETQIGGYMGDTNPSLSITVKEPGDIIKIAKDLGYILDQESMTIMSQSQIEGTDPTSALTIQLPENMRTQEALKNLYDSLYKIRDRSGNPAVTGHSTVDGNMLILNYSTFSGEELAEQIGLLIPGVEVTTSEIYSAWPERKDYGRAESRESETENNIYDESINNLRAEASRLLEGKLAEAEGSGVPETTKGMVPGNESYTQRTEGAGTGQLLEQSPEGTEPGIVKGSFDPFTGEDGAAVIKLFENADASTVIHETGHYFIESLWREIAAGRATEQQKADFEKLMKYCGITTAQWAKMDLEGRRAAHERLAEAIETYVMEDKAPSRELRPVFKRFAKWLKSIYSAISRNRNAVPLTDEVREVFDRMLASEEDVEQMRRVEGYFEKLPAVITDNLSDATKKRIEDYILKAQDKAVEILTRERLANFTAERQEKIENFRNMISDEVRQEVANRPLYVAARQAQELLGGEKPASARQYANLYLEEKLSDENEVKWEIVAEQNNMTPMELAQKLIEEPTENEAYEAAMKEAVQKEFPDYYTDRAQAEEATREAMYNDESGILLGVEQVLIEDFAAKAAAQQRSAETARKLAMAKRQQAKVAAQKELANMKLKDAIRVDRYINAERRCAVKSAEAMAKKDYETARHYKDMQAFNHAMVIESANLRKRKQQYDKLLRRLYRSKREAWTSEQHFNQAMALFARMGLERRDYDPTTRTQSLVEYVNEMSEMFYPFNEIPDWLADDTWPITNPNNMRFEDYEKVIDLMRYIKTMAKVEKAANFFDSASTYQEWRDSAIENLNKLATKFTPILGERQVATWTEKFQAAFQTLDNFLEKMDGWHFGFFSRTFGDAIKHANDNEFNHIEAYQKRKTEIEQAWCPTQEALDAAAKDVYYEELGASASKFVLTKMLMNLGNEGNARKLCSSYPSEALRGSSLWVFENGMLTKDEAIAQTKENLLEFLGRVLTEEDIAYAQAKIDLAGMYWGEMADLERRTKGFTPKKVEAYPVKMTLANGKEVVFRGGYFPLIRNGEMGSHPVGIMPVAETDANQGKNVRTMYTDTGHMISRVEAEYPVDLTEGSEDRAMRNAIHDLCWRETMTDFRRILNDQFMFGLMKSKLGIADMTAFREMLEHAAQPNGSASMAMGEGLLATTAGWLRRKTVNSIVMLNLRINLQNFGNLFLYGNTVEGFGYSDVLGAMANALSNGFEGRSFSEMWDFVDQKSAFMRSRSETPDITLADLREENKLNKFEREAMKWGARAMMYTDGVTARPVWMQAYTKKINDGATEQEAIDFADTIIRRTLGSGRITDVSSLQRGGPVYKLFTAFQGFFNTQFNQWMREYNIDRRLLEEGNTAEAVQRITSFVASKYLAACFFNLVLALQNPFADDDDDEYKNYTTELLHYPMSLIGIYGPVANFAMDKTLGIKAYSYRMSIIESSLDKIYRASGKLGKMIDGDFEQGLEGLTDVAGIYAGVPAQMNRLFWNAYDIVVNGMDPKLEDLATRRPKRERKK